MLTQWIRVRLVFFTVRLLLGLYPLNVAFAVFCIGLGLLWLWTPLGSALVSAPAAACFLLLLVRFIRDRRRFGQIPAGFIANPLAGQIPAALVHLDASLAGFAARLSVAREADLRPWGQTTRITSSFADFLRLEAALSDQLGTFQGVHFIGHNDFDHVTLALLRRIAVPFNLVLFDAHADWHTLYPYHIMCGSWVMNAFRASKLTNLFHIGGVEGAFDSTDHLWDSAECYGSSRAMQAFIDQDRVSLMPANRTLRPDCSIDYRRCFNKPLLRDGRLDEQALAAFVSMNQAKLARYPAFLAVDKDVLREEDNCQPWKGGVLARQDLERVVDVLLSTAGIRLLGMSLCGENGRPSYDSIFRPGYILDVLARLSGERTLPGAQHCEQNFETNLRLLERIRHQQRL